MTKRPPVASPVDRRATLRSSVRAAAARHGGIVHHRHGGIVHHRLDGSVEIHTSTTTHHFPNLKAALDGLTHPEGLPHA